MSWFSRKVVTPPVCRDCTYIRRSVMHRDEGQQLYYAKCGHPSLGKMDLVTGEIESRFCSSERFSGCGPSGKHFEATESNLTEGVDTEAHLGAK